MGIETNAFETLALEEDRWPAPRCGHFSTGAVCIGLLIGPFRIVCCIIRIYLRAGGGHDSYQAKYVGHGIEGRVRIH